MRLKSIQQGSLEHAQIPYDLALCASGYESRARYVAEQIGNLGTEIRKKVCFGFKEHSNDCARPANDAKFRELSYEIVLCSSSSTLDVRNEFLKILQPLGGKNDVRILVDISCMTRAWYGEIVHVLINALQFSRVHIDFAYTPSEFVPAQADYPPNRVASPVPGFFGMAMPDKPTALGIGLGYDRDRAIGLKDYLDPKLTILLSPNPSLDFRYVDAVRQTNEQILSEVSDNNIVDYPVNDGVATFCILSSLCDGLARHSRVVLCSLGPKIFGLCCFLIAAVRREISIWRVSADDWELPFDRKPFGTPIVLSTTWELAQNTEN